MKTLVLFCVALVACDHDPEVTAAYDHDHDQWVYDTICELGDPNDCFRKLERFCGHFGYEVVDKKIEAKSLITGRCRKPE